MSPGVKPRPLRLLKALPSSGSSSDESAPRTGLKHPTASATTVGKTTVPLSQGMKRKRPAEKPASPPPAPRPMTMMRKVISTKPKVTTSAPQDDKPPIVRMRKVQGWVKPSAEQKAEQPPSKSEHLDETQRPGATLSEQSAPLVSEVVPPVAIRPSELPSTSSMSDLGVSNQDLSPRRVTRSGRGSDADLPTASSADSFMTKSKPSQGRRKPPLPRSNNPLTAMSALALKTLTISNTSKNQKQVAELQTKIIRKDGKRPDSPTTKVRTNLDQQKDARDQERRDRAERRAKRLGTEPEGDGAHADESMSSGSSSVYSEESDPAGNPLKHRRGPGDEEDYATPERPPRPAKKERLDEHSENEDRRVKWDRGLVTTVFLDGSPPKPRHNRGAEAMRGCLAHQTKVRFAVVILFFC